MTNDSKFFFVKTYLLYRLLGRIGIATDQADYLQGKFITDTGQILFYPVDISGPGSETYVREITGIMDDVAGIYGTALADTNFPFQLPGDDNWKKLFKFYYISNVWAFNLANPNWIMISISAPLNDLTEPQWWVMQSILTKYSPQNIIVNYLDYNLNGSYEQFFNKPAPAEMINYLRAKYQQLKER